MEANSNHPLTISLVGSRTDLEVQTTATTWAQLCEALKNLQPRTDGLSLAEYLAADSSTRTREKDSAGWMPCSVTEGGRRKRDNILSMHALVLDIDHCASLDAVEANLSAYEYVLHTSYSHHPANAKCRVVLPLAASVQPESLPKLFDHFNALIGGVADSACGHDPARMYYLPACPKDAAEHFVYRAHAGALVDPHLVLESKATVAASTSGAPEPAPASPPDFTEGYSDGQRTAELTRRAGWCLAKGMSLGAVLAKCLKWNECNTPPLESEKVIATCESIQKTHLAAIDSEAAEAESLLEDLNVRYAWVTKQARIFRFEHADFISSPDFRNEHGTRCIPFIVNDRLKKVPLGDAWIRWSGRRQHKDVVYAPGQLQIVEECINLWRGWGCASEPGAVLLWVALLDFLFEGRTDHRKWFEQWLAYPIKHPGVKLNTAAVLWSTRQGVGKTLIGETIGKLYGADNFKTITAAELHGSFNGWAKGCQFVLGEENASSDHRADSNKLKHLITGETISVNEKFQPAVTLRNSINFLFTSNHPDAFHLETHDRRFFIWEIAGAPLPAAFYERFVNWIDGKGGREALMHHLQNLDLTGFDAKAPAPVTDAKSEMIELSRSDLERWLSELADPDQAIRSLGKEIVTLDELVDAYALRSRTRTNTTAVGKALRRVGVREKRRIVTGRGRAFLVAICRSDHWRLKPNDDWGAEHVRTGSVRVLATLPAGISALLLPEAMALPA